jgi:hypothetical protein
MNIIDMAIVLNGATVDNRVPYTRMNTHASRHFHHTFEDAYPHVTREMGVFHILRLETFFDEYLLPVIGRATLLPELLYFFSCKGTVVHYRER